MVSGGREAAYKACERRARTHYENFPVASVLLPSAMRRHVSAVYAFARVADDFADEGSRQVPERLHLLDGWGDRLQLAINDDPQPPPAAGEPADTVAIFTAVAGTIADCSLPGRLFADLISAFRQDVLVHRYEDWPALFDYARRSANPVGRLVLRIAGHRSPELDQWSDAICTALQFTNFWQDFDTDAARGRIYLPASELARQGLTSGQSPAGPALAQALHEAVAVTRQLFTDGRPLCDALGGRLRYELRATWLGGVRILDRVERHLGRGATGGRPTLAARDAPWLAWRLITWAPQ